jgi:hypothetical protein
MCLAEGGLAVNWLMIAGMSPDKITIDRRRILPDKCFVIILICQESIIRNSASIIVINCLILIYHVFP